MQGISLRGFTNDDPNYVLEESIKKRKEAMLDAYVQPYLPEDIKKQLDEYLIGRGYDKALLECVR